MGSEETLSSRQIYKGKVLNLRVDKVRLGKGAEAMREIVEHAPSVVVVPVDAGGDVFLVRQYRKPAQEFLLEAPAGSMEEGEKPRQAAIREMEEETGYTASRVVSMGGFWLCPGYSTEFMYAFIALRLKAKVANQDEDEEIQVERIPLESVPKLIREKKISDAKSIAALLMVLGMYRDKLDR